ncbi:MAG TPA: hypothetical protein PKH93_08925, partial [Chitinophagales bacterium]|nr:hypothetical protein [Chitinophagales bacterium]
METLNFSECTLGLLENKFGLIPIFTSEMLANWVRSTWQLQTEDLSAVSRLSTLLTRNAEHWNEIDLSMHFIGPMFS